MGWGLEDVPALPAGPRSHPESATPSRPRSRLRTPRRATQSLPRWTTFPTGLRAASFRLPSAGRLREVSWSPALCKRERGRCGFGFPLVSLRDLQSVTLSGHRVPHRVLRPPAARLRGPAWLRVTCTSPRVKAPRTKRRHSRSGRTALSARS